MAFLLVVGGAIGGASYLFSSSENQPPSQSVVDLSVQQAGAVEISQETNSPSEAAAHIRNTWDRRVSVPTIDDATLTGVGKLVFSPDLSVPALLYADTSGSEIVALAFNYALVDRLGGQATLERTLRKKLAANDDLLAQERRDRAVVLWRQRDDIFVLVAPNLPPDSLRARVRL
jgi:hypothetical protein